MRTKDAPRRNVTINLIMEDGTTQQYETTQVIFNEVYVLYKNGNPVYCGCTMNIAKRIKAHRWQKDFDSYRIVYASLDREKALQVESGIIKFVMAHNSDGYNGNSFWGGNTELVKVKPCKKMVKKT